jgi:hypothetical protein
MYPTQEELNNTYVYDPESGKLYWRSRLNADGRGGELKLSATGPGYTQLYHKGKQYISHKIIWIMMTGTGPKGHIDHLNGKRADNEWKNLRDVTVSENCHNRLGRGTSFHNRIGKWYTSLTVNGKRKHLGYFNTESEAHAAYCAAKALNSLIHRPSTAIPEPSKESQA